MPHFSFANSLQSLPASFDPFATARAWTDWRLAAKQAQLECCAENKKIIEAVANDESATALLDVLFGNSPYLTSQVIREVMFICELLQNGPDTMFSSILSGLTIKPKETINALGIPENNTQENSVKIGKVLRIAKRQAALTIAIADIANVWSLAQVTEALSDFAEKALDMAATHLFQKAAEEGAFELVNPNAPLEGSGFIIIGMGKLGARELNYSSDIDLIVLYDTERIKTSEPDRLQNNFVRLTRNLVKLISERTAEGYVFRTDLRLRPDPGATPLTLSRLAAETYYESLGQNWERAAMIKARPVAGDIEAGQNFLKHLVPFVWRRNLDFAAIQDVHSIKRQINAHSVSPTRGTRGHNIKLGHGGIREIEFFAQTQQLIWGGREPQLRSPDTITALSDLAKLAHCDETAIQELTDAYVFLRQVEHRLQMINDEQSQILPTTDENFQRLAIFLGFKDADTFNTSIEQHTQCVQHHYAQLFADAPNLDANGGGNLVFTGRDADPETLQTLRELGFCAPELANMIIRAWHHGRYRAMQSVRAREILTEILPQVLKALSASTDPTAAILSLDAFFKGLPSGVQLFSMFQVNPDLLNLITEIIGTAPKLAEHISKHPSVIDSVLTGDFFGSLPNSYSMRRSLKDLLDEVDYFEAKLDVTRRWCHDQRFKVGVHSLQRLITPSAESEALSKIAETAISCLIDPIKTEFQSRYGQILDGHIAIVAMGKLGSREMTLSSDLDLIFIYSAKEDTVHSDGIISLPCANYYTRLGQRIINAITAPTSEGSLYEVDMRLRPSGNTGPISTSLKSFSQYQVKSAWTWEHMALTRARIIYSTSNHFCNQVQDVIKAALVQKRDLKKLLCDVAEMRTRIAKEKPVSSLWVLKRIRGGIIDIEFIAQFLLLKKAFSHPRILEPVSSEQIGLSDIIKRLSWAGYLDSKEAIALTKALKLYNALQSVIGLNVSTNIMLKNAKNFPEALKRNLAGIVKCESFEALEAIIRKNASRVYAIFVKYIESPANNIKDAKHSKAPE